MAGGLGFEPRQTDPESVVLPLHHPPPKTAEGAYYNDSAPDAQEKDYIKSDTQKDVTLPAF